MYLGYFIDGMVLHTTEICFSRQEALQELADLLRDLGDYDVVRADEKSIQECAQRIAYDSAATGIVKVGLGVPVWDLMWRLVCRDTRDEAIHELQMILDELEGITGAHERLIRHARREVSLHR